MKTIALNFKGYWVSNHAASIPTNSGIYCVYAATYSPNNDCVSLRELIYVGESDNVAKRLANHERIDDWRNRLRSGEVLCYSVAPVEDADRVRSEAAIIYRHKPTCNTEYTTRFPFNPTVIRTSGANHSLQSEFLVYSKL